jgi:NAD(P)H-hydrate epimerase
MNICVTGRGSKEVDRWCIEKIGIPSVVLMERAAMSVCEEILKELSDNENGKVFICCGTGNNGADGLAVGRILLNKGINTHIYILGNMDKSSQEFMLQYNILNNIKANVTMLGEEVPDNVFFDNNEINVAKLNNNDIIVDAIFGIGLSRNVEGKYRNIIEKINASGKKVISIDIPSGLCADRGVVMGCSVKADKTVTFGKMKAGLVLCYGKDYSGEVVVKDVGFL